MEIKLVTGWIVIIIGLVCVAVGIVSAVYSWGSSVNSGSLIIGGGISFGLGATLLKK